MKHIFDNILVDIYFLSALKCFKTEKNQTQMFPYLIQFSNEVSNYKMYIGGLVKKGLFPLSFFLIGSNTKRSVETRNASA